ncbi:MAG: hypothetical protein RL341_880 [Pseudomonadota bacterium]
MNVTALYPDAVQHLAVSGVDIYVCDLRVWQAHTPIHLSAEEADRASKFVFARHRHAFERAHQFLRETLGRALGTDPSALTFKLAQLGKPALPDPRPLHFNLSHSEHHAAVAISRFSEVGVDIEDLHPVPDALALAEHHFTSAEQAELLASAHGAPRDRAFLQGWTRKEACLKAIGSGLSLAAQAVEAGLAQTEKLLTVRWEARDYPLALTSFATAQGVIGAVATAVK